MILIQLFMLLFTRMSSSVMQQFYSFICQKGETREAKNGIKHTICMCVCICPEIFMKALLVYLKNDATLV